MRTTAHPDVQTPLDALEDRIAALESVSQPPIDPGDPIPPVVQPPEELGDPEFLYVATAEALTINRGGIFYLAYWNKYAPAQQWVTRKFRVYTYPDQTYHVYLRNNEGIRLLKNFQSTTTGWQEFPMVDTIVGPGSAAATIQVITYITSTTGVTSSTKSFRLSTGISWPGEGLVPPTGGVLSGAGSLSFSPKDVFGVDSIGRGSQNFTGLSWLLRTNNEIAIEEEFATITGGSSNTRFFMRANFLPQTRLLPGGAEIGDIIEFTFRAHNAIQVPAADIQIYEDRGHGVLNFNGRVGENWGVSGVFRDSTTGGLDVYAFREGITDSSITYGVDLEVIPIVTQVAE